MGYRNPAQYRYEPALAPLRGRDDFRLLLLDLAFPADPFARRGGPGAGRLVVQLLGVRPGGQAVEMPDGRWAGRRPRTNAASSGPSHAADHVRAFRADAGPIVSSVGRCEGASGTSPASLSLT